MKKSLLKLWPLLVVMVLLIQTSEVSAAVSNSFYYVNSQGTVINDASTYSGMKKIDGKWMYVVDGEVATSYTGLVKYKNDWVYVVNGHLDTTYTGLVKYNKKWVYVSKGKLDISYTGMVKYKSTWVYVNKGKLDAEYTGLAKNKYGWWHMTNGKLDLTYTGMSKNEYGWWYVENGKLDMSTKQRNFILIGDSYLYGETPDGKIDSWGVYLANEFPQYTFSMQAIRGSGFGTTVPGKNFLDALKNYSGDKNSITDIVVCGGFNDAAVSISADEILTGIDNFVTYVNANFPNAKVHIGYIGASTNGMFTEQVKNAILVYRACGSKGCGYISNMEYVLQHTRFFTSDGVHPNTIGQKNIAWYLASYFTTGNVSVAQQKLDCEVVADSTVIEGITLYTSANNGISTLYHSDNEHLKFAGLSAVKMNGEKDSRITLGMLTNSTIIGNQTASTVDDSLTNASVSIPINVSTESGWYTGIGTLEIINLNVVLRVNVLDGNTYLDEAITGIIIPPFTAVFDSLDV